MKRTIKYLRNAIVISILGLLIVYIIGMRFFPTQLKEFVGYQTFVILTDSMEPTIPVGSLVLVRNIKEGQEIPENTIVSFQVDRLGVDSVFTHYYRKKEADETGQERYFTQGETADRYDDYITYREDLIGTYVLHIPFAGRFVQFLQSPFAFFELGITMFIMVIYSILWDQFDKEEKEGKKRIEAEG